MAAARKSARALRLRISLREIEPEIWRVLLIRESSSLAQLHDAIQRAMGWTNSHLHDFELLEALRDAAHPEHESYLVWVGGRFDPEAFDLRKASAAR